MTTTNRTPIAADVTVTGADGNDLLDATGAGAPGAFMLDCALAYASHDRNTKAVLTVSAGMRRFLNAGIRSGEGVARLSVRDAEGADVVEVVAVRREVQA